MIKWQTWCFKLPSASAFFGVLWGKNPPSALSPTAPWSLFEAACVLFPASHPKQQPLEPWSVWSCSIPAVPNRQFSGCVALGFLGEMERFNMKRSIVLNSWYSINFVKSTCLKISGPQKNPSNYRFWTGKPIRWRPALRLRMFNPNGRNAVELVDLAMALPHFTAVTLRASLALLKASMAISNASWRWQAGMRASRISDWQHVPYNVELVRTINYT